VEFEELESEDDEEFVPLLEHDFVERFTNSLLYQSFNFNGYCADIPSTVNFMISR
jgi:hypothetical protein